MSPESNDRLTDRPQVIVGIVEKEGNLLLVQPLRWSQAPFWQFPGGKLEPGESEPQGVVREVWEETGISCVAHKSLGRRIHPQSRKVIAYWLCDYVGGEIEIQDQAEIVEARWVRPSEVLSFLPPDLFPPVHDWIVRSIVKPCLDPVG